MTERDKKLAIIGGTVLVALLILLFIPRKAAAGETVVTRPPFSIGDVTLPGFDMPSRDPIIFPILPGYAGDDSGVIGSACCATCDRSGPSYYVPAPIFPAQQTTFNISTPRAAAPVPRARGGSSASFMQAPVPFITQWIGGLW